MTFNNEFLLNHNQDNVMRKLYLISKVKLVVLHSIPCRAHGSTTRKTVNCARKAGLKSKWRRRLVVIEKNEQM